MTPPSCRVSSCDKPSREGPICPHHLRRLLHDLAAVGELAGQLEVQRSGLARRGPAGGAAVETPGLLPTASRVYDDLCNTVSTWARDLWETNAPWLPTCSLCGVPQHRHAEGPAPHRRTWPLRRQPLTASTPAEAADWIVRHQRWLARHEALAELYADIDRVVRLARSAIDQPPDLESYGQCNAPLTAASDDEADDDGEPVERCTAYLYGRRDRKTVTCRECGYEHDADYRNQAMREDLEDAMYTAAELGRLMPRLLPGRKVTAEQIRAWAQAGRIKAQRVDDNTTLYRTGDVLDVATTTPTRRRKRPAATTAS